MCPHRVITQLLWQQTVQHTGDNSTTINSADSGRNVWSPIVQKQRCKHTLTATCSSDCLIVAVDSLSELHSEPCVVSLQVSKSVILCVHAITCVYACVCTLQFQPLLKKVFLESPNFPTQYIHHMAVYKHVWKIHNKLLLKGGGFTD